MDVNTKTSFEDKFNKVLKPAIDKYTDSKITNSMSEFALNNFISNKKNNVKHLLEIRSMASSLNK